jgi:hypothetical protein
MKGKKKDDIRIAEKPVYELQTSSTKGKAYRSASYH